MNDIEMKILTPFANKTGLLRFHGAYAFPYPNRNLLLGKNGNMILLDDMLFQTLVYQEPDSELWFKLVQRGLAEHDNCTQNEAEMSQIYIAPSFFMIDMTNNCNISCRYCLREECSSTNSKVLNEKNAKLIVDYIIRYCRKYDLDHISIQPWGGEPLLEKDLIFKIQDLFQEAGINVSIDIETNGILLTDELVSELFRRGISYGISLDGNEELNDLQRVYRNGNGTYHQIRNAIQLTKKYYGENMTVLATITKQTVDHVSEILEHFANDLKLKRVKLNFAHKSGFKDEDSYCVYENDVAEGTIAIMNKIIELNENGISFMEYNFWIKLYNILTNRERDICLSRGCSGGKDMITIDMDGGIYPCDVTDFPEERIGMIDDSIELPDMVKAAMSEKDYFALKSCDECKQCPWKHFCNGGCTVRIKCTGGQRGSIDRNECSINKVMYPRIIRLIQEKPQLVNQLIGFQILHTI